MPHSPRARLRLTLHCTPRLTRRFADRFRGQPVILAFYPADWSPVCGDQMALYNEMLQRVPEVRRGAARHLGGRRLVPSRVRARTASCTSRCLLISSRRATSLARTASIAHTTVPANGRCSSSMRTASSGGATCLRSASTRAPTASCARSKALEQEVKP